jgi:TRAP-type C4-dicarboxylate transport system permease small subunit
LNRTIVGAYEFTENYLMVATGFLGICYAYHRGVFIRVTFFVDRLPIKVKRLVNYLVQFFSFLMALAFVISTAKQAFLTVTEHTTVGVLSMPVSPAYCIVPVGFFLLSLLMAIDLWRAKRGKSDLFK